LIIPSDKKEEDRCGNCNKCIEACPTNAISSPYILDARKCISYQTIEYRGSQLQIKNNDLNNRYIFGCDICQEVCPWNRFSTPHNEESFIPEDALLSMTDSDWENLTKEKFNSLFRNSAVKRAKYSGLKRNIDFYSSADNK